MMVQKKSIHEPGKLLILAIIFTTGVLVANIMATKVIDVFGIYAPMGIIVYPITFLMTDTITEVWGKQISKQVILGGLIANIFATVVLQLSTYIPAAPVYELFDEYAQVIGGVPRIAIASIASYYVSHTVDVHLFIKLNQKIHSHFFHKIKQKTNGKHLWLRNNVSTMTSQIIDSVVFMSIAFLGTVPLRVLLIMMGTQYVMKLIFALADTPFVYVTVKWAKGDFFKTKEVVSK